ncbi:uncharacterized protein LOC123220242 [Mangifera indica]|uniref:uncharacterized protein LOC123220242 n=1 Tax=Mangifera indica TaxID=29780 RepID=UPI001CFC00E4|nr:uncharacterized protein LOC123220242 [Mangifera indica]XP_044498263.1 uncharacterized protein LOC123220242 [Mangifera indica]
MENKLAHSQKVGKGKEDSLDGNNKDIELSGDNGLDGAELKTRSLVRRVNSQRSLILNVKQLLAGKSFLKKTFLQSNHGLDAKIPKHMVTLDERYLRWCLELIHTSASKAAQCSISMNMSSTNMGILWDDMKPAKMSNENPCDMGGLVFECPLATGRGSVLISPAGQWIVGSVMGSKSMINILKSPLLSKFGALDGDGNFRRIGLNDIKGPVSYDFISPPGGLSNYSSQKLEKKTHMLGNRKNGSETVHNRLVSVSSTNSSCSDQSSSSAASTSVSLGMLQCMWKGGKPHFVFSVDERKEVYIANLSKTESAGSMSADYMYTFHLRKGGEKEHGIHDNESLLVGKMKVSTSFTFCRNDSKIMETQFTLFSTTENFVGEMEMSCRGIRKNKSLSKKVVEVFRNSHSSKQFTLSKYGGSSALETSSWEQLQNMSNNLDAFGRTSLIEDDLPPNLELAAIVVKDHLPAGGQKEAGGWGLKFLKKVGVSQSAETLKTSARSVYCAQDSDDCSTSMDILIPAGFHGGPRTRNGGPSGLIERWRSGGCCDCGGWDLGCPLTVLNTRFSRKEVSPQADIHDEFKSFDLFMLGSELKAPTLRMVNIRDGLYFIHFQSNLSALQSLSIAVASVHSQSPSLRPENIQE